MKADLLNVHQFQFSSAGQMEKSHWEIIEKRGEILKSKMKNQAKIWSLTNCVRMCFARHCVPHTLIHLLYFKVIWGLPFVTNIPINIFALVKRKRNSKTKGRIHRREECKINTDDRIMIILGNAWDRGVSSSGTPQPPDGLCPTTDVSINLSSTETSKEAASVKMTFGTLGMIFCSFDIRLCHWSAMVLWLISCTWKPPQT